MDRSFLALVVAGGALSSAMLYAQHCNEHSSGNVVAESELKEGSGLFLLQQGLLIGSKAVPNEPMQLTSGGCAEAVPFDEPMSLTNGGNNGATRMGVARARSVFSLNKEPSVTQQSHGNRCGSHDPPTRTPKVCVFLFTALENEVYRNRTLAAAKTWASHTALDHAGSFSLHFFVDPKHKHFVESVLTDSQMLDYEEGHVSAGGAVPYTRLKALNSALQSQTCDWVVVPEDDTYMNLPLVADKLSCLDSAGPPRLLGALFVYSACVTSAADMKLYGPHTSNEFVHGSSNVMNAAAVPVLWEVAKKQGLDHWPKSAWGDVSLAQVLRQEYGPEREQAFPYQELGCTHLNNAGTGIEELSKLSEPECIDWFHKVLPETMIKLHESVSGQPCQRSSADLMENCVAK